MWNWLVQDHRSTRLQKTMWPFAFTSPLTHSLLKPRICQQHKSIPCTYHKVQVYYTIKVELSSPCCHAALNKQIDEANLNIISFGRELCSVLAYIAKNLCWIGLEITELTGEFLSKAELKRSENWYWLFI